MLHRDDIFTSAPARDQGSGPSADPVGEPAPLLLHVFPGFGVGGAQIRFAAIANHFGHRYRHAVIAIDGLLTCRERLDQRLDIAYLAMGDLERTLFGRLHRYRAFLRERRPDLLVTYNWGTIEWAIANAIIPTRPLIRHVHVEDGFGPDECDRQLRRRVTIRRLFLGRSMLVVPSRCLLRIATDQWRLDPARLRYIPNGIDSEGEGEGKGEGVDPSLLEGARAPVVGTVAGLRAEKNLARLLRAFRLVLAEMPASLLIVGDGPERADLQQLAEELGIKEATHFLGHVAQPRPLYREFDVFALSSDTEQMPMTVIEAMAVGLPVVAPDVGDIKSMVAAENAPLIVARDESALAASLRRGLTDAKLRREIGRANRRKAVEEFGGEAMFRAYRELFDSPASIPPRVIATQHVEGACKG